MRPSDSVKKGIKRKAEEANTKSSATSTSSSSAHTFKINPMEIPANLRQHIGTFLHRTPEASSTGQMLLGLKGSGNNPSEEYRKKYKTEHNNRAPHHLSDKNPHVVRMFDVGSMACAVTRRVFQFGRGNVKQDIIATRGKSYAQLHIKRKYFDDPTQDTLSPTQLSAMRALAMQAGNCGECARVAYCYLATVPNLPGQVYLCSSTASDHAFLVMKVDSKTLICDPWLDFVGIAADAKNVNGEDMRNIYAKRKESQPPLSKINIFTEYHHAEIAGAKSAALSVTKERELAEKGLEQANKDPKPKSIYDLPAPYKTGGEVVIPNIAMVPKQPVSNSSSSNSSSAAEPMKPESPKPK